MLMKNNITVFYRDEQTALNSESFSPSAGKPEKVVESWSFLGLPKGVILNSDFKPASVSQISMAHDPAHVRAILKGQKANGFGNTSPEVAKSLRWTSGSMVAATLHALETGGVGVSPTSGFHHAGYASASAFCTFNGLMVAAQMARLRGATKVGIIDCDAHYGNGTDQIIEQLGLKESIRHWTFGEHSIGPQDGEEWLAGFARTVSKFQDCDVLLYQAGADPHIEDPLGGHLTTEQMRRRDQIVFSVCKRLGIPVAWNLAGGYQKPLRKVLDLHDATMQECVLSYLTNSNLEIKGA